MKKYLITGVIVQIIIIVLRWALGKSKEAIKENKTNEFFWIAVAVGSAINILCWPISIVAEILATKEGN